MYRKIKVQTFYVILALLVGSPAMSAKVVATKKPVSTPSVYGTVKNKCDDIIDEKKYSKKIEKLDALIKLIKSKVNESMSQQTPKEASQDPYLAAWQNADFEFDFLKTLFVQNQSNEYINCKTISFRLSENLSNEIKKDLQPYIELAKLVSKNLCSAQVKSSL